MTKSYDYLLTELGELEIKNGDFKVGLSEEKHVADILLASPGHYRQYPTLGARLFSAINSSGEDTNQNVRRRILLALAEDGLQDVVIEQEDTIGTLSITATRP